MIARDSAGIESRAGSFWDSTGAVLRDRDRIPRTVHRGKAARVEEIVAPQDPMLARIVGGREAWYSNLTIAGLDAAASPRFELVKLPEIHGLHRCLYLFHQRSARP